MESTEKEGGREIQGKEERPKQNGERERRKGGGGLRERERAREKTEGRKREGQAVHMPLSHPTFFHGRRVIVAAPTPSPTYPLDHRPNWCIAPMGPTECLTHLGSVIPRDVRRRHGVQVDLARKADRAAGLHVDRGLAQELRPCG